MYNVKEECFDERWQCCHISTLVVIYRCFTEKKTGKVMEETSYYISNQILAELNKIDTRQVGRELFQAIRSHWTVENQHQIKDVTLKEDLVRSKDHILNRVMASLRTVGLEIIRASNTKNFQAQIEAFNDKPTYFGNFLKKIGFVR